MKGKNSRNLLRNFVASFIAIALLVSGAFFFGTGSNVVIASDSESTTVAKNADGYYVKPYTAKDFASFREDTYTYPKLTTADGSDYQEWLFAGWFTDDACTAENAIKSSVRTVSGDVYAKFVDADLSYVKCQVTPGTEKNSELAHMRLISAVESNDYSGTGFYITYKGNKERRCPSTTVYRRLSATEDGMECAYSPIAFNEDAEYLSAIRLTNVANTNFDEAFYIQSYWVTLDGTEVLGMSRYARIEDSYEKIVNVPVRLYASDVDVTSGSVSVTYEAEQFSLYTTEEYNGYDDGKGFTVTNVDSTTSGKITVTGTADNGVAEGLFVNLRLKLKDDATIESYTEFAVADENFEDVTDLNVSNVIFKNYPLAYNGTPDTSWYQGFENNTTFVITSAADLYGLASIVNDGTDTFKGNTVYLGADITVNKGQATADNWITNKDVNGNDITDGSGTAHKWTPIGYNSTYMFCGTFDGCGNTIEGIYMVDTYENSSASDEHYSGLFGITFAGSMVRNFKLTNSYFESELGYLNHALMGSVVGQIGGDLDSVYSDAIVKSAFMTVGGLVGRSNPGDEGTSYMSNCWFDGSLTIVAQTYSTDSNGVGGILGRTFKGKVEITDCLNTANISYTTTVETTSATSHTLLIGGINGGTHTVGTNTLITSCVNAGTISYTLPTGVTGKNVDSISGWASTTNCIDAAGTKTANYNGYKGYTAGKASLSFYDKNDEVPGNWVCRPTADSAINGIPVLKRFCDEWIDVSWYYDDTTAKEFTINSAEAFYGWSEISNKASISLASDVTVKLGADIKMNTGNSSVWAKSTNTNITDALRKWTPIKSFAGTFDGQMHTISGVYLNTSSQYAGLFGQIDASGVVKKFYITNSLFKSTSYDIGSVAGVSYGTVDTVYSNATVIAEGYRIGGIVGHVPWHNTTAYIKNCWFDGQMELGSSACQAGGILGYIANEWKADVSITNCLYTGSIDFKTTSTDGWGLRIGGIVGGAKDYWTPTITIENCLSAGKITQSSGSTATPAVSAVYGGFDEGRATTLNLTNVYGTNECFAEARIYHQYIANGGATSATLTINGTGTLLANTDLLGTAGYQNTHLDFGEDGAWVARQDNVPGLKAFVQNPIDLTYAIKPDTSWYNKDKKVQEIQDEADMYGFLKLMLDGNTFADKEVHLKADLNMNQVKADTVKNWADGKEVPVNEWLPATKFAGTFDGEMHTISGVYLNTSSQFAGLFGQIDASGIVKNFYITDSLFKSTSYDIGSVAGASYGTVDTVYSNATIIAEKQRSGGIVGHVPWHNTTAYIKNCWFDGEMELESSASQAGGILGYIAYEWKAAVSITNCLYTGSIDFKTTSTDGWGLRIGGIVGGAKDYWTPTITIENCLSAGKITQSSGSTATPAVSVVYGGFDEGRATTLNLTNVYGTNECFAEARIYHQYIADGGATSATQIINGTGTLLVNTDLLGTAGYQNTLLDFEEDGAWVTRKDNVPGLKAFTKVLGETVSISNVEQNNWYNANETVFGIGSASALKSLGTYTNATNKLNFKDKTIYLTDDIEVNQVKEGTLAAWKAGTGTLPTSWTPIGVGAAFNGTFNGQMHTISGLYLNTSSQFAGLFGQIDASGVVKNFYITDSLFKSTSYDIGSVVGASYGTVDTVYSNATIIAEKQRSGGIVGHVPWHNTTAYINNCWFDGQMELGSSASQAGGILGYIANEWKAAVSITNCLYTGSIDFKTTSSNWGLRIGGIVGGAKDYWTPTITIENCISAGRITQSSGSTATPAVSAVYGGFDEGRATTLNLTNVYGTNECFAEARIYHQYVADGGATGATLTINGTGTLLAEADLKDGLAYVNTELDFENTWVLRNNDVPGLKAFAKNEIDVEAIIVPDIEWYEKAEAAGTYEIKTAEEMYGFGLLSQEHNFDGIEITLGNDIELNIVEDGTVASWEEGILPVNKWTPIGTLDKQFAGTFDGKGKTISGLYANSDVAPMGLFGATAVGSEVKDFRIVDSYLKLTNTSENPVGSAVGRLGGDMSNVYSNAIIYHDYSRTGGLVGVVLSRDSSVASGKGSLPVSIENCWFDGKIVGGATDTARRVGGIVGKLHYGKLTMNNILFTGTIDTDVTHARAYIGGLVGVTQEEFDGLELHINSAISAGKITGKFKNPEYVGSIVGSLLGSYESVVGAEGLPQYSFTNVFATRDCYNIPYAEYVYKANNESAVSVLEGTVVMSSGDDRLLGYIPQGINGAHFNESVTVDPMFGEEETIEAPYTGLVEKKSVQLDFTSDNGWTIRTEGVPVLKCFADLVQVVELGETDLVTKLTAEVGLDVVDANTKITAASPKGAGNYVVTYDIDANDTNTYGNYCEQLEALGFKGDINNNGTTMNLDGVYSATFVKEATETSGEWVINVTYVDRVVEEKRGFYSYNETITGWESDTDNLETIQNKKRLYVSISTDVSSVSDNLIEEKVTQSGEQAVTLSMLEDTIGRATDGSNAFVFQLPNGHFIINDGGYDPKTLITYMRNLTPYEDKKVVIDAWTITHFHDDHIEAIAKLADDATLRDKVYVEGVYASEPSTYGMNSWTTYDAYNYSNRVMKAFGMMSTQKGDEVPVYQVHMGQRYYFNGVTMDVLDTQEQHLEEYWNTYVTDSSLFLPDPSNTASTQFIFTIAKTGKRVLLGGDATVVNMNYMMQAYGENPKTFANINVFAAYHHGKNVTCVWNYDKGMREGTTTWYDYMLNNSSNEAGANHMFDAVLFPRHTLFVPAENSAYPLNTAEINDYLIGRTKAYYTWSYGDKTGATSDNKHGSVKLKLGTEVFATVYKPWDKDDIINSTLDEY